VNAIIRKLSVGPDYVGQSMHYIVGQSVVRGEYTISEIKWTEDLMCIYVESDDGEVLLWKSFTSTMPMGIEYDILFDEMFDEVPV
jgi:hypothetical protein